MLHRHKAQRKGHLYVVIISQRSSVSFSYTFCFGYRFSFFMESAANLSGLGITLTESLI